MTLNPFIWTDAVENGVPRGEFTVQVAHMLKGGTHLALFGARGIGKTTFISELARELIHEETNVPSWDLIAIDLRRVISLPAFTGAIIAALEQHPNRRLRRRAKMLTAKLEKEVGINLGFVKAGIRTSSRTPVDDAEITSLHLRMLADLTDRIVIAFDEFQRLSSCPGDPLSLIRSSLMGPTRAGRISLLLTGSLRERLRLMLHTSTEPIWDQTHDIELPDLDRTQLIEYLEHRFQVTRKPITEEAVETLVGLTNGHPKRTQQLAWHVWASTDSLRTITLEDVMMAFENLISPTSPYATDFERLLDTFLHGTDSDINNAKTLLLLAGGVMPGSNNAATRYGLLNASTTQRALQRLKDRGLVIRDNKQWKIVDPLLAAWLQRQNPIHDGRN